MKVKGGEMSHLRQVFKGVFLIKVGIDVIHYAVDALEILLSRLLLDAG